VTVGSINPTTATHPLTGSISVPVSITGSNLLEATGVSLGGAGVNCPAAGITSTATTVSATCNVASTATLSTRNVRVTTPIGQTPVNAAVTFTVN
jgi:hypothetical protein